MNDEREAPPVDQRGAVARLTEALAEAQAAARSSAAELGPSGSAGDANRSGRPGASGPATISESGGSPSAEDGAGARDDLGGARLRDRIEALPLVGGDARDPTDQGTFGDQAIIVRGPMADEATADPAADAVRPRRRLGVLYVVMALLILAVPALVWTGYRVAAESTAGEVLSGRPDPGAPGYTALIEPTPVALVMLVSDAGKARGLTVLSLSGPGQKGGVVMSAPADFRLSTPRYGITSSASIIDVNSTKTAGTAIGTELGLGFTEIIEVTDSDLVRLLQPVAPLRIDNPEVVTEADGTIIDAGPVDLAATDVPGYLSATDSGRTVSGKLARQQLVWKAWIDQIGKHGGAAAIPGESDVGLGRFLGGLAAGDVQTATFPIAAVEEKIVASDGGPTVKIDHDPAMLLVANAVPFPVASVPGDRATVALLNGSGPDPVPSSVLQRLSFAGAQIISMGNAPEFGQGETTLTYSDADVRPFASAMAEQLGVGKVVRSDASDNGVGVTIVMGRDLLDDPPAPLIVGEVGSK